MGCDEEADPLVDMAAQDDRKSHANLIAASRLIERTGACRIDSCSSSSSSVK
jgi:hypothetical protein